MEAYKNYLKEEVEILREKGHAFLDGTLSRNDLKGFSGGMGSYAQKEVGKFMIRLRTPSGVISKDHFRLILKYAKESGIEKVHLTTRQAVQLHDLDIDRVCDIMKDAIDHDLFTRGGGGNFPRNVALSPLAGVDPMEVFDVTPFALQVGDYFLRNATSYKLPRKLKVAFSSSEADTAGATINDVGFAAVLKDGRPKFKMWLAGGMGSMPGIALPYDEWIDPEDVLYYIEAMVRLFIAEGDYEHKAKARTRFIPRRMGEAAFFKCYKEHLKEVRETCHFEGIHPVVEMPVEVLEDSEDPRMIAQRQRGLYTAVIHPLGGQLYLKTAEMIEGIIRDIPDVELRLSLDEELFVRNLTKTQAETLLEALDETIVFNELEKNIACVGTPTCQTGVNQSQLLCREIAKAVRNAGITESRLPRAYISGCPNCCSRHAVVPLGFAGCRVKVDGEMKEAFECYIGGRTSLTDSCLAVNKGKILADKIPELIVLMEKTLKDTGKQYEDAVKDGTIGGMIEKYCLD